MAYKPGDIVDDRYEIRERIGAGGHGVVYRAEDRDLRAQVALKALHSNYARSKAFTKRMQREAHAMGKLAGTCAVQVMGFHKMADGGAYLVMELLEGCDLNEHLKAEESDGRRLPTSEVLAILGPIARTLQIAHDREIVHRDVKLANVFLLDTPERGRVRLLDFGLVKDMRASIMTMPGTVPGSPAYIAPEAWLGTPEKIDHRVDIFSFGVLIYRVLASRFPFKPNRPLHHVIKDATEAPRPSLAQLRGDLPPAVDAWVEKALAVEPDDRFQSVQSLWLVIEDLLTR